MGLWDNIFKRKKTDGQVVGFPQEGGIIPERPVEKKNIAAGLVCELTMDGDKYMLKKLDVDFDRSERKKYVPVYMEFIDRPSPGMESWITRSSIRKDGCVRFFQNSEKMNEGAVFTMAFYNASCVGWSKVIKDGVPSAVLKLAVKRLELAREEYDTSN